MPQDYPFAWTPGKRVLVVLRDGLPGEYLDEALYLASVIGAEDADFFHMREGEGLENLLRVANRGFYGAVSFPPVDFGLSHRLGARHAYQEVFDSLRPPVLIPKGSFPYKRIILFGGGHGIDDLARATGAGILSWPRELEDKDLLVVYRKRGARHSPLFRDKALILSGTAAVSILVVPE
ncbi:MAG: hypothetical protein ABIM88_03955 [candidate division WOR-3 bacterium]